MALILPLTAVGYENVNETAPETKLEHLSNELQLTADQKAKLEAIFNERHEKIRAIREDTQNRVKAVLTEEQQTNWEAMKKHRYEKPHR